MAAIDTAQGFEVMLAEEEEERMQNSVCIDGQFSDILRSIAAVDAHKASASYEADKAHIFEKIARREGDFHGFNTTIAGALRSQLLESVKTMHLPIGKLLVLETVATLALELGDDSTASAYFNQWLTHREGLPKADQWKHSGIGDVERSSTEHARELQWTHADVRVQLGSLSGDREQGEQVALDAFASALKVYTKFAEDRDATPELKSRAISESHVSHSCCQVSDWMLLCSTWRPSGCTASLPAILGNPIEMAD